MYVSKYYTLKFSFNWILSNSIPSFILPTAKNFANTCALLYTPEYWLVCFNYGNGYTLFARLNLPNQRVGKAGRQQHGTAAKRSAHKPSYINNVNNG